MDLVKRREILINLISRVGRGKQNVYCWVDELMKIDAQLEQQEQEKQETTMTTTYEYIIKFSDSDDYISEKKLTSLAVLWRGVVKDGDILTSLYPEDFCDDRAYFPVRASWDDYVPKYSEVEAWEVPTPTEEEWQKAVQDPNFLNGKPYTKWLEATQPWTIVKFIAAHHEWRTDSPSYSRESSDGYRSGGSGGDRTKHYQVLIPDTWTWQSAAGTQAETQDENTPPKVYNKYTYEWYVERIQAEYKDGYFARQRKWKADWKANKKLEATKEVAQKVQGKAAKPAEKPKDSKGKHPLASKKVSYPDLKKYFYGLYPQLQEYEDYIQLSVGELSVAFECRIGTVTYEHELYGRELGDIYSFNENKKVDKIVTAQEEALLRAKKFKAFADAKAKEVLVKKEMLNLEAKKQKEYQKYRDSQKSKGGVVKSFEKWLQTVA